MSRFLKITTTTKKQDSIVFVSMSRKLSAFIMTCAIAQWNTRHRSDRMYNSIDFCIDYGISDEEEKKTVEKKTLSEFTRESWCLFKESHRYNTLVSCVSTENSVIFTLKFTKLAGNRLTRPIGTKIELFCSSSLFFFLFYLQITKYLNNIRVVDSFYWYKNLDARMRLSHIKSE